MKKSYEKNLKFVDFCILLGYNKNQFIGGAE
jgi:hypothetical protein